MVQGWTGDKSLPETMLTMFFACWPSVSQSIWYPVVCGQCCWNIDSLGDEFIWLGKQASLTIAVIRYNNGNIIKKHFYRCKNVKTTTDMFHQLKVSYILMTHYVARVECFCQHCACWRLIQVICRQSNNWGICIKLSINQEILIQWILHIMLSNVTQSILQSYSLSTKCIWIWVFLFV